MKGKLTAFLLSGTLVVSGISQIVLADDQIKDPVIEKNDEEILQEETKVNPKLEEDQQKQVDEESLENIFLYSGNLLFIQFTNSPTNRPTIDIIM